MRKKGKKKVVKNNSKRRQVVRRRIVFGVICFLLVLGAVIGLVCVICQPFSLKGITFSLESGFYSSDINIEIEADKGFLVNAPVIRYNMNGDDLKNTSMVYDGGIKLEMPEVGYKVYTITAFACENEECTEPETATYVLGKNLEEDVTVDIININSSQKNLYDYDIGIMVGGRTYDENETVGANAYIGGNYNNRGKKWMREAYITRFSVGGGIIWDQPIHLGISGGTSAAYDVKSFKISNDVGTFRLRSGSQDQFSGNIRSSVVDRLAEETHFDGRTGTKRMVVFLNGDYYGIFDMQDTFSEENLLNRFGLEKEKNIEKFRGSEKEVFEKFGIKDYFWENLDLIDNRERLEELFDMDDYLKYYAIFILVNNTDWPMNNFGAWRYKNSGHTDNKYEDGKIRFLIRDMDLIYYTEGNIVWFKSTIGDIFEYLMEEKNNGMGSSFRKVMESEYYRQRFIDLLRDLIDGPFATENVLRIVDEEAAKIEHQVKLFSSEEEYKDWTKQIELLKKAILKREDEIKADVQKYFGTEL